MTDRPETYRRRQRAWRSAAWCAALTAGVAFVALWVVTFDAYTWTEGSAWAFTMLAALLLALLCVYLEDRNRLLADELEVHRRG